MKTHDICDILDGEGFDIILIETVGVGQIELDIAQAADVTITVLVPESGDDIQAMKAGIMEISDIFVVNKADRHGSEAMVLNLRSLTKLRSNYSSLPWEQPVIKTVATEGTGINEVFEALESYRSMLKVNDNWDAIRRDRMRNKIMQLIESHLSNGFWTKKKLELLNQELTRTQHIEKSPFMIVEKLLNFERKA